MQVTTNTESTTPKNGEINFGRKPKTEECDLCEEAQKIQNCCLKFCYLLTMGKDMIPKKTVKQKRKNHFNKKNTIPLKTL